MAVKKLAAFDFDHTIVDDNSDTAVMNLIEKSKIPKELRALHKADGWTAFMQAVFKLLNQNRKDEKIIKSLIKKLPPVAGMIELINRLKDANFDIIIISDSNSLFIDVWLEHYKIKNKILKVFTNPAEFINGMLKIKMYHLQNHCKLSTKNLCKGQILQDFITEQTDKGVVYGRVIYCGDGSNDFCPILRLIRTDLACVRDGYKCVDLIKKSKEGKDMEENGTPHIVRAEVFVWCDGFQIIEKLGL